jgi:hypothetical protein
MRVGDWKLVWHYRRAPGERAELFNLAADPAESRNLAGEEAEVLERMVKRMRDELEVRGAQWVSDRSGRMLKPGDGQALEEAPE